MKRKILFVDDDAAILSGLRRMLRSMQEQWDMSFISSPREALIKAKNEEFDVVVSDMRMPEIDGAQLLREVRESCPGSVRLVLSGQADKDSILKVSGPAHQYLSKPCDHDNLKRRIGQVMRIGKFLSRPALRAFASGISSAPSILWVKDAVREELLRDNPSLQKVSQLIFQDVALAAKIMQLVSSEFFGRYHAIFDIGLAVELLGAERMRDLWLSSDSICTDLVDSSHSEDLELFNAHSRAVSHLAGRIARAEGANKEFVQACETAGLLHDIGKITFLGFDTKNYCKQFHESLSSPIELREEEQRMFGANHAQVGAYLLGLWGLADPIIDAVLHHHTPTESKLQEFSVLSVVHVANGLQDCFEFGIGSASCRERMEIPRFLNLDYLQRIQKSSRINDWLKVFEVEQHCDKQQSAMR